MVLFAVSGIWLYSLQMVNAHGEMHHVEFNEDVALSFPEAVYEELRLWWGIQTVTLANATTNSTAVSYAPETTYFETVATVSPTLASVSDSSPSLDDLVENVKIEDADSGLTSAQVSHYKELLGTLLNKFPSDMVEHLDFLTLRNIPKGSRGLAGANSMILRVGGKLSDKEITAVGVHEFGHIVDLGYFTGNSFAGASNFKDGSKTIYNDDKSLEFYTISWDSDTKKKKEATSEDFVSGYAESDPFEDFAESFIMYVLHGKQFKKIALYNNALGEKYTFMRDQVFKGTEFLSNEESETLNYGSSRPWDATLEKYDFEQYLGLSFR